MTLFKKKEIHNIASKSLLNIKSIHYESVSASFCKRAEIRFYTKVKHQYRRSILYAILLSQFKPACKGNVFFFFSKDLNCTTCMSSVLVQMPVQLNEQ